MIPNKWAPQSCSYRRHLQTEAADIWQHFVSRCCSWERVEVWCIDTLSAVFWCSCQTVEDSHTIITLRVTISNCSIQQGQSSHLLGPCRVYLGAQRWAGLSWWTWTRHRIESDDKSYITVTVDALFPHEGWPRDLMSLENDVTQWPSQSTRSEWTCGECSTDM